MVVQFPEIDPYEILSVDQDSTQEEIKKSYRKLCLKYHPDKLVNIKTDELKDEFKLKFEQVQFSHSILSDPKKRKRYDRTGSFEELELDDAFDWYEYFNQTKAEINDENIAKDKAIYQNSEDEIQDVIEQYIESKGDFLSLFETIPHTTIDSKEEERLFQTVSGLIKDRLIEETDNWKKYLKRRKLLFRSFQKKQLKEEKEAEELKEIIQKKHKMKLKGNSEENLKELIVKKRKMDMDTLISNLENKYGQKKKVKKEKGSKKVGQFTKIT